MEDLDPARRARLTVSIRHAAPGDRSFVEWLAGTAFSRFGEYGTTLGEAFERPEVRTLVAAEDRRPVGFAMLDFALRHLGEAHLVAIAVDPERRREGIGRALLAAAEEVARSPAPGGTVRYLVLETASDNDAAIELFREAGFVFLPGTVGRYPAGQPSRSMIRRIDRRG